MPRKRYVYAESFEELVSEYLELKKNYPSSKFKPLSERSFIRYEIQVVESLINRHHSKSYVVLRGRLELFKLYLEGELEKTVISAPETSVSANPSKDIIIQWNENKNVIISIFSQLKKIHTKKQEPLISNSNEEIAQFLKNYFSVFDKTKTTTIVRTLEDEDKHPKKLDRKVEIILGNPGEIDHLNPE